jgi:hypothetical protein
MKTRTRLKAVQMKSNIRTERLAAGWIRPGLMALLLIGLLACQRDERERLFELVYPNTPFEIPAGLSPGLVPRALVLDGFTSNLRFYLDAHNTDTSAIAGIFPFSATIRSLDGTDLDFIREVSVRMCPLGSGACTQAEEVFYINDLQINRVGSQIRLLPTLINAKRHFVRERFKLEVWFFLYQPSPFAIPCRLEMAFEAVR